MEDITQKVEEVLQMPQIRKYFLIDNFRELIENYDKVLCADNNFDYATHCLTYGVGIEGTRLNQRKAEGIFNIYHTEIRDDTGIALKGFFLMSDFGRENIEVELSDLELRRILNPRLGDKFNLLFVPCSAGKVPFLFLREIGLDNRGYGENNTTNYPPTPRIRKPELVGV